MLAVGINKVGDISKVLDGKESTVATVRTPRHEEVQIREADGRFLADIFFAGSQIRSNVPVITNEPSLEETIYKLTTKSLARFTAMKVSISPNKDRVFLGLLGLMGGGKSAQRFTLTSDKPLIPFEPGIDERIVRHEFRVISSKGADVRNEHINCYRAPAGFQQESGSANASERRGDVKASLEFGAVKVGFGHRRSSERSRHLSSHSNPNTWIIESVKGKSRMPGKKWSVQVEVTFYTHNVGDAARSKANATHHRDFKKGLREVADIVDRNIKYTQIRTRTKDIGVWFYFIIEAYNSENGKWEKLAGNTEELSEKANTTILQ